MSAPEGDGREPARSLSDEVLRLDNVERRYGEGDATVHALRGVSFAIHRGELVSMVGPSGCGKSTLLNLIGCLDRPTRGRVLIEGEDVSTLDEERLARVRNQRIGFIFQTHNLLSRLTAQANVELPLMYAGRPKAERAAMATQQLERVGLGHRRDHLPSMMSGGERQRVAIARALVMSPSLLLADEPTGSLDTRTGGEIVALIESLNKSGSTILLVTHDADLARRADRMLAMRDGMLVSDTVNPA